MLCQNSNINTKTSWIPRKNGKGFPNTVEAEKQKMCPYLELCPLTRMYKYRD